LNKIKWIIFSAVAIGVLGWLVVVSNGSKIDLKNVDINAIQTGNDKNGNIGDYIYGKVDSKVTLIEYADYQCPGCASEHPKLKAILEDYKDKIRFVFRNFPLTTIHANAKAAAGATEAAGLQGKYWEMHNKIYENQSAWSSLSDSERTSFFANYAKDLGLDVNKFNTDIASQAISDKINYDKSLGDKAGVKSTPSFYLNGTSLNGDINNPNNEPVWGDDTKFKAAIDAELAKQ
jgi:protein-disulfide isomerase